MKLTFEQIKSVTLGAISIYEDDTGIHFRRFTDRQLAVWDQLDEQFRTRSRGTAGCQLSFHTDSKNMMIFVANGKKVEVWINGLPTHNYLLDAPRRLPISLPEGDTHVVIDLPNYTEGVITKVLVDEGSYIVPHTTDHRFLFLGDSITQGSQSSRDSNCYVSRLGRYFNAEVLNLGIGGSVMCADTLEDTGFDPDAIFIAYGTNDYTCCESIQELEAATCAYFDRVKELYPDKPVFYISPLWRADGAMVRKCGTLDDCRAVQIAQALSHGFVHIDGYTLVPHSPDYYNDGYLHPNDIGFSYYSENLIKFLTKHL